MLLIIDDLKHKNLKIESLQFYDPIFTFNDKYLIEKHFNFNIIENNDEARWCVKESVTLFYMPHCGKPLYNNLLYSNWTINNLNKLYLIGNSFDLLSTMTLNDDLINYYKYIKHSLMFLKEAKLCSKCSLTDAFSDISLHVFKPHEEEELLFDLSENNDDCRAPVYESNDEIVFAK